MLAEVSIRKMNLFPSSFVPLHPGRRSVVAISPMSKSCKNKSKLCRNRCHSELTCRSSIARLHRYVLGTASGCRRSLRKYSAIIAGGTRLSRPHCHHVSMLMMSANNRRTKDEGRRTKDEGRRTKDEGERFVSSFVLITSYLPHDFVLISRAPASSNSLPPASRPTSQC